MPTRPLRVCGHPGCGALVERGRCAAHDVKQSDRRRKDPAQAQFYGSARWKAIRRVVKARQPICEMCERAPTQVVDHRDGDWTNNDPSNHRGLCRTCNASHTARQHRRKGRG